MPPYEADLRLSSEGSSTKEVKVAAEKLIESLKENRVFFSGSSVGKGLQTAAANCEIEDAFYVVDLGMVVSQVYQWRKSFGNIEPFYAVKCNPDPLIVKTLALLGVNFDCASRNEIRLVQSICADMEVQPEIIYANPCKAPSHLKEAVERGVRMVTFDNYSEIVKCAGISRDLQLVLRIATDDRGSQCRLSSKFGAPAYQWKPLLAAAKEHGLDVVGVSFHVGSGCRDAGKYELALKDARHIFDMAKSEFGFELSILDLGGGWPGETYSIWNPESLDEDDGKNLEGKNGNGSNDDGYFMFFSEIAEQVTPAIEKYFPADSGVRLIGEPGRFMVAACATLCCSVLSCRVNQVDSSFEPTVVQDQEAALSLSEMSREEEKMLVHRRSVSSAVEDQVLDTITEELADYSMLYARQTLAQQEADTYNDSIDFFKEDFNTAADLLGPPEEDQQMEQVHTVEGMTYPLVGSEDIDDVGALVTLAAAGEAAVSGMVMQAVADCAPLQDDYAYYITDGVYSAFNNIMYDHAAVRPRVLHRTKEDEPAPNTDQDLFPSTIFGPTCDSIDVVARSVLLPKLEIGDWLYFQNMGAYTMAASSSFNGFTPSERFYVCSVQPEYIQGLVAGPKEDEN